MSAANRFNRHIGNKKGQALRWRATRDTSLGPITERLTRQARRMIARAKAWSLMSWGNALISAEGIIPRRIRRSMALELAKRRPHVQQVQT